MAEIQIIPSEPGFFNKTVIRLGAAYVMFDRPQIDDREFERSLELLLKLYREQRDMLRAYTFTDLYDELMEHPERFRRD